MVLIGIAVKTLSLHKGSSFFGAIVPIGIVVGSALYTIRSYEITPEHIAIKRLLWSNYLTRHDIEKASAIDAPRTGWRLAGNGGLFSFSGLFWNEDLGRYRAYSTGGKRAVLLEYSYRKVVLTPDDPEAFVRALQ